MFTAANYIALASFIVALTVAIFNIAKARDERKREQQREAAQDAAEQTTVLIELKSISNGISDIKAEINTVKQDTKENTHKLIALEQSLKSEHKRLDGMERRLEALEKSSGASKEA